MGASVRATRARRTQRDPAAATVRRALLAAVVIGALIASGCTGDPEATPRPDPKTVPTTSPATESSGPAPTSEPRVTTTTTRSAPPTGGGALTRLRKPSGVVGPVAVARVVDGDTVYLADGSKLRLIGLDTPETVDPRKPVQCFGREASARAHELLDGTSVFLETDPTQGTFDKYGRTLAYLWMADGRLYNELMIASGYAHEYTYDVPYRYRDRFIEAEAEARAADRGLSSPRTCNGDTTRAAGAAGAPSPTPLPAPGGSAGAAGGNCDPSYPDVCIPPAPPDLDCGDVSYRRFRVVGADPHRFDGNRDGIACTS